MQSFRLSKADSKVLAQVFDPESGPAKVEVIVDPGLPANRHINDAEVLSELRKKEREAIKFVEDFERSRDKSDVTKVDVYHKALDLLDTVILDHPQYASARNNRAQLRRWRFGDRDMLCQRRGAVVLERSTAALLAVADLKESIALASPPKAQGAVSPSQGRLLGQAYTQLAALYYAASKDLECSEDFETVCGAPEGVQEQFEEEASRLFYLGGLYGSEVGKALAVHTNPHAKLCGNIVQEAMRKEMALV